MRTKFAILLAIVAVCAAAVLAEWTPEALVTGDDTTARNFCGSYGHALVFGPDGVGHLAWYGGSAHGICCNRYNPPSGGSPGYWTPDFVVTQSGGEPTIALDADGVTIHAVWDDGGLRYSKCTRNDDGSDEWSPVVPLYTSQHPWEPTVACVPGDPGHLVACYGWSYSARGKTSHAIAFMECIDGVWSPELRLDSVASKSRIMPAIVVAPNGDVFIAYTGNDDNTSGRQVYVKTRHNGAWGATVDVTGSRLSDLCYAPAIDVNSYTGNPHVVFTCRHATRISKKVEVVTWAVYHCHRNSGGVWQTPGLVSVPRNFQGYLSFHHAATVAFASNGSGYATWHENEPATSHGVMYSYCSAEGGTWGNPVWLTTDTAASSYDRYPFVAVDAYGNAVHVVWGRVYTGTHIEAWWRSSPLGGGSDGGNAEQATTSKSLIELFPNPARAGRVTIQYALPRAEPMRVTLLDVSGRAVRSQTVAAGLRGSAAIDVSGLTAGVYVARLVAGDLSVSKSLVIGR